MTLRFLAYSFLILSLTAEAEVSFTCYESSPVQAYEYSQRSCDTPSDKMEQPDVKGPREILCMYNAYCKVADPAAPPTQTYPAQTRDNYINELETGVLKASILTCVGEASYRGGQLLESTVKCPSPSQCQRDIFYNYKAPSPVTMPPNPITIKGTGTSG